MVQREQPHFALKRSSAPGSAAVGGKKFRRDRPSEFGVERAVHDAHASAANFLHDLVMRYVFTE